VLGERAERAQKKKPGGKTYRGPHGGCETNIKGGRERGPQSGNLEGIQESALNLVDKEDRPSSLSRNGFAKRVKKIRGMSIDQGAAPRNTALQKVQRACKKVSAEDGRLC